MPLPTTSLLSRLFLVDNFYSEFETHCCQYTTSSRHKTTSRRVLLQRHLQVTKKTEAFLFHLTHTFRFQLRIWQNDYVCTVESKSNRPPRREERRFLYFNHLSTEFMEQMILHLKALIQGVQNLQKNWAWHHLEGGYTPLTEKVLLLLELIWSLS